MLLANMAVAHQTYKTVDDKAFLRSHPPPGENPLNEFKSFCKYNNFEVDTSSSLALQQSLNKIIDDNPNISKVVAHFLLKAMQMARYLCVGVQNASASFHHYALNVPLYTHFTSPIRRYADVIVHRLLAASLSYRSLIKDSVKDLHRLSQKCNEMKMNARIVSESSARLFLNIYIKQVGKMEEKAVVVQVYDHSFDVMLLNCGVICRVYLDQLPLKEFIFETKQGKNELILKWKNDSNANNKLDSDRLTQTISACLIVKVQVSVNEDDSNKLNVSINLLLL
jgi:DIS3-like exonuclease 2